MCSSRRRPAGVTPFRFASLDHQLTRVSSPSSSTKIGHRWRSCRLGTPRSLLASGDLPVLGAEEASLGCIVDCDSVDGVGGDSFDA